MTSKNHKGAITVFISIVLSSIFLVIGTFSDAARLRLAHSQIQRASKTALSSLLACYNNDLKDEYGLFGLYADSSTLEESYTEYFMKNLGTANDQNFLYDYCLEQTNITQPFSLLNRNIFEGQLGEFMKYRAPIEAAQDLINKINGIKNISSGAKVYKRKLETDKKASELGKLQISLKELTNKINNSKVVVNITRLKKDFTSKIKKYEDLIKKLDKANSSYSKETDETKKESIYKNIKSIKSKIKRISSEKEEIKNDILNYINEYKSLNMEALVNVNTLFDKKTEFLNRVDGEMEFVKESIDEVKELQQSYIDDLNNLKSITVKDNSKEILSYIKNNITKCDSVLSNIDSDDSDFILLLENLSGVNNVNYTFSQKATIPSNGKDNREGTEEALKETFNKKEELKTIDDDLLKLLPSRQEYSDESSNIKAWGEVNLFNGDFAAENLDYISSKEGQFSQIINNLSEQLYINEYIMGTFKHNVKLLQGEGEKVGYNLRSKDKEKRDAFFTKYEVEYVISGCKDEALNHLLVNSEILAIRLISNVIHIYTDSSKMARITGLAAGLSAWNAGLSTPLIETLLVFSWAAIEAVYDLEELEKGNKISLFKTKDQWKTDISGAVNKKSSSGIDNNPLSLSYKDYLKIFLTLMDKDKKLARVQDLVQLNMDVSTQGFLLSDCKVFVQADTTVSLKNIFISLPSFTMGSRKNLLRSYITERMYIGY